MASASSKERQGWKESGSWYSDSIGMNNPVSGIVKENQNAKVVKICMERI
jgi:hypothetical protein